MAATTLEVRHLQLRVVPHAPRGPQVYATRILHCFFFLSSSSSSCLPSPLSLQSLQVYFIESGNRASDLEGIDTRASVLLCACVSVSTHPAGASK